MSTFSEMELTRIGDILPENLPGGAEEEEKGAMVGRTMPLQRHPRPDPQNLELGHLMWQRGVEVANQ